MQKALRATRYNRIPRRPGDHTCTFPILRRFKLDSSFLFYIYIYIYIYIFSRPASRRFARIANLSAG